MNPPTSPACRQRLPVLLLTGALWLLAGRLLPQAPDDEPARPLVPPGPLTREQCDKLARLTPEEVEKRLGRQRRVSRQILYHRYLEQWLYEHPYQVRVEIDFTRGKQPQLQSVLPLSPANP